MKRKLVLIAALSCLFGCPPLPAGAADTPEKVDYSNYHVYYNAIQTEESAYLIALGWANEAGWKPSLMQDASSSSFTFGMVAQSEGDISAQVITPFSTLAEIDDPARSVMVRDAFGEHQVQVFGIKGVGSGSNEPGKWIESGKAKMMQDTDSMSADEKVKVTKADWDLRPKTKFLRIEGYVTTDHLKDEVIAKVAEPQGINERVLLINIEVKQGSAEEDRQPRQYYLRLMTMGDEPWEEVQAVFGDHSDTLSIRKLK